MKQQTTRREVRRLTLCLILAVGAISSLAMPAHAAGEQWRAFEYDLLFPKSAGGALPQTTFVGPEIAPALEEPIEPATYRVVPGDLLQLDVGGETDRAWRLAIDAEGNLVLPAGETVPAFGRTLAGLVEVVRTRLADQFPKESISLHLLQPGSFRVPITGLVANPSLQIFRAYDRVAFSLSSAGGPRPGASLRGIVLRHPDGSEETVDLVRFAHLGEMDQNPTLGPGSGVHVPPAEAFVWVAGAVRGLGPPGRVLVPNIGSRIAEPPRLLLEWKEGDTIGFTLIRAGGLSEDASGQIVLMRDGKRSFYDSEEVSDKPVLPGDVLEISMRERYVYVVGAVRFPGPYAHLPSMTAADYVRLAGGPTQIGRGSGWRVQLPDGKETEEVGPETYLPPGSTVTVPERWTHRVSTLLAPISGVTALIISLVALRQN